MPVFAVISGDMERGVDGIGVKGYLWAAGVVMWIACWAGKCADWTAKGYYLVGL